MNTKIHSKINMAHLLCFDCITCTLNKATLDPTHGKRVCLAFHKFPSRVRWQFHIYHTELLAIGDLVSVCATDFTLSC